MCVQQEGILKAGFGDFLGQSPCIDVYKLFFFFLSCTSVSLEQQQQQKPARDGDHV